MRGLRKGDVIQEVNHASRCANPNEFASAMQNAEDSTLLLVNRQGNKMYLAV